MLSSNRTDHSYDTLKGEYGDHYQHGLRFYEQLQALGESNQVIERTTRKSHKNGMPTDATELFLKQWAIASFKKAISAGENNNFSSFLLLAKLHTEAGEEQLRNRYFYNAVQILKDELGEKFINNPQQTDIIDTYLSSIDTTHQAIYCNGKNHESLPVLYETIVEKSKSNIQEASSERKKQAIERIKEFLINFRSNDEIFGKLSVIFEGPLRILIISRRKKECIINHGYIESGITSFNTSQQQVHTITVVVGDKEEIYDFIIDRGVQDTNGGFSEQEINVIIHPFIRSLITNNTLSLYLESRGNTDILEKAAGEMVPQREKNDYRSLIEEIIQKCSINDRSYHHPDDIDTILIAINLALDISLQWRTTEHIHSPRILQMMGSITGSRFCREILDMVTTMLASQNETVNGFGYPFGHSREDIPLAGKIFQIIWAYEVLSSSRIERRPPTNTMEQWEKIGYFDPTILHIFLDHNTTKGFGKKSKSQNKPLTIPEDLKKFYSKYLQKWSDILTITKQIGDTHHKYQLIKQETKTVTTTNEQRSLVKTLGKLRLRLIQVMDVMTGVKITRHCETWSDTIKGLIGTFEELLTEQGIKDAQVKGQALIDFLITVIFTSPVPRAIQTAQIICQKMNNCVQSCLDCSRIMQVEGLGNPKKDLDNGRYEDSLIKLITDNKEGGMTEFVRSLISSTQTRICLIISHRDPLEDLLLLLQYIKNTNENIKIDHDTIITLYLQGGKIIEGWEKKICFSIEGAEALREIDIFAKEVFGIDFYHPIDNKIHPPQLHTKFLDFCDNRKYDSPDAFDAFIEQLKISRFVRHFPDILKTAGILE